MAKWHTACGWNFTKNPEKVSMAVTLHFNQYKCRKCLEVKKARDRVKEGKTLAGFINLGATSLLDAPLANVSDRSADLTD